MPEYQIECKFGICWIVFSAAGTKASVWTEKEYTEFIEWISANPKSGDVIKGSGGVRKIRWTGSGHGKRGGARIIFYSAELDYVYLMTIYAKNQRVDISAKELRAIKELIE